MGAGPVAGVTQLHGDVPTHRMDVVDGSHSSVLGGRDQGLQLELLHGTDRGKVPGQQGLGLLTEAGGQFGQSGVSIGFHVNWWIGGPAGCQRFLESWGATSGNSNRLLMFLVLKDFLHWQDNRWPMALCRPWQNLAEGLTFHDLVMWLGLLVLCKLQLAVLALRRPLEEFINTWVLCRLLFAALVLCRFWRSLSTSGHCAGPYIGLGCWPWAEKKCEGSVRNLW